MTQIKRNDKFVGCWGYDQTQYSIYNVVDTKGQFVLVEGLNGWSTFRDHELAAGSKVKIYKQHNWNDLTAAEQQDFADRGFRWDSYQYHYNKDAKEQAEVRTITKMSRINGQSWTYIWTLDNGEVIRSDENYELGRGIEIVHALKRCKVQISKWNDEPYIKINDVITASLDEDFDQNVKRYHEQNEYTAYNGR